MLWNKFQVEKIIKRAINEDLGMGDLTTDNLIPAEHYSHGRIKAKEDGVIAGLEVAEMVFTQYDKAISFNPLVADGDMVKAGDIIAELKGSSRGILKGERIALNFLQRLSGIATRTRNYINLLGEYPVRIVDTRKTTPTLRLLEKYAVTAGGGSNHRMGLFDAVMIKDNHILVGGGISRAVKKIKEEIPYTVKIEVEVEDMNGVQEALAAGADIIMLDNMSTEQMREAVSFINGRTVVEASGGITEENLKEIASTGVDVISVGALTHHIKSLDISLDLIVD